MSNVPQLVHSPDLPGDRSVRNHPDTHHGALPRLLTVRAAARYLDVSETSVYRYVERRELTAYRVGRGLRFSLDDLAKYLASRRLTSTLDP